MSKKMRRVAIPCILLLTGLTACSSSFVVRSEPFQADVFILDPKTGEKKPIGKTPIEMPTSAVRDAVGDGIESSECFSVVVEKKDFLSEKILVPMSRFGTLSTQLDVKLKKGDTQKQQYLAQEALDHLFLARGLALTREFDRAQVEVDKVLLSFPDFPRALAMRASIYFMQGRLPDSLKWYEESLKADPHLDDSVKMIARIRAKQGAPRAPASTGGKP